jgi:Cu/Ag efflux pump CusA
MIDRILSFAIEQRWVVLIAALAMAVFGVWNFTRLPIDAVPDITNVQVQINSSAPGLFAARSGAACHVSDRDRDGRSAAP